MKEEPSVKAAKLFTGGRGSQRGGETHIPLTWPWRGLGALSFSLDLIQPVNPEWLYLLWQHVAMALRKLGSRKGLASSSVPHIDSKPDVFRPTLSVNLCWISQWEPPRTSVPWIYRATSGPVLALSGPPISGPFQPDHPQLF